MKHSDTELEDLVVVQIGPEKANFIATNDLGCENASDPFSLGGTGVGGAAGFATCDAEFELIADDKNTLLHYSARAKTSGQIA